jgi:3'(2'), 5'-bisphosphate nucleotidase
VGEEHSAELRVEGAEGLRAAVVRHVASVVPEAASADAVLGWIDHGGWTPDGTRSTFWTLDPIDGTKGFLRGEQYAIALALIVDGKITLGVLGCPNLSTEASGGPGGLLMAARRGHGCRMLDMDERASAGRLVKVSPVSVVSQARFCESVESGHSDQEASARIAATLGITAEPYRIDSQCKYAAVARGDASIYLRLPTRPDYRETIWDHAAGVVVVEEAGGTVTDVFGRPLDFTRGRRLEANQGIIATNGRFHERVVAAVRPELKHV